MAKVSPIFESLNAGELSPLLEGRTDFAKYKKGLKLCENWIPLVQGPLTRRPGTKFVAEVRTSAKKVRIVAFEFSTTQAYIIEFGDQYCRFYKDRGQILASPGDPFSADFSEDFGDGAYEVETPYLEADLADLYFAQSADVLYIAHPDYAPRKLSRTGHTAWTLTTIEFKDGPYLAANTSATTIAPSATSGNGITLTASTAIFAAEDVGRLVRVKHSSTWGYAEITAFTSTTQVTADVKSDFGATTASADWRLGVWSEGTGYPAAVTFYGDRLFLGGATMYPQRIDGSVVGDYENFAPSSTDNVVADDNAVAYALNANNVNVVKWMSDDEKGLIVGTIGGEWIVRPSNQGEALTPTNVNAKRSTRYGTKSGVMPIGAGKATLFVQRAGRKLRELAYVFEDDGFRAPDMTVTSSHITKGGVVEMAYQQQPQSIVWAVRGDGVLLGFTYEREQEVLAWHKHPIGGTFGSGGAVVESVAVIPNPAGDADELWLVVKRTINGSTKRYIEYLTEIWTDEEGGPTGDQADAFFVDCGLTYDGSPATTISGIEHLEGETVAILADGATHPHKTVSGGAITLDRSASTVQVGYGYQSNGWTERVEGGSQNGTAQGKTKRINRITVRLWQALGLKMGPNANSLDPLIFRTASDPMGAPPPLFSGDKDISNPSTYEKDGRIYFRVDDPLPCTILALMPDVGVYDR